MSFTMDRETFYNIVEVRNMGVCNMLDFNCINENSQNGITKEEHKEYIDEFDNLQKEFKAIIE